MLLLHTRVDGAAGIMEAQGNLLAGETDSLLEASSELVGQGVETLVLDLSAINALDAGGVGALLQARQILRQSGGTLRLVGPKNHVHQLLDLCALTSVFHLPPAGPSDGAVGGNKNRHGRANRTPCAS